LIKRQNKFDDYLKNGLSQAILVLYDVLLQAAGKLDNADNLFNAAVYDVLLQAAGKVFANELF